MANTAFHCREGFTILEVLLVLVFISIFATIAVMRQPPTDVSLKASAEQLKSHLRYAQMRAMNTTSLWGIRHTSGYYRLFQCGASDNVADCAADASNWRILPGESQTGVDHLTQKSITITEGDFTLSFDGWGRPAIHAETLSLASGEAVISLSKAGQTEPIALAITENTGFIHWNTESLP